MLMGLSILDSKMFMIKFSALVFLCHEKIYKLRFSSLLSLLLANFGFYVINTALPQLKYEVRARSSAGEHLVDIEGVTGSIPVVPTTST